MRKFDSGLLHGLTLDSKAAILNNDVDISRPMMYIQQVKDAKKK